MNNYIKLQGDLPLLRSSSVKLKTRLRNSLLLCIVLSTIFYYVYDLSVSRFAPPTTNESLCRALSAKNSNNPRLILQGSRDGKGGRTTWVEGDVESISFEGDNRIQEVGGEKECEILRVPSSPRFIAEASTSSRFIFGVSTTAGRAYYNLPVWLHWLDSAPRIFNDAFSASFPSTTLSPTLPIMLVLTGQHDDSDLVASTLQTASGFGINLKVRPREGARYEIRYLGLVQELWLEAKARERESGIVTDWFVIADDDTFFPDFDQLPKLLSAYDPSVDNLIGSLSEAPSQVEIFGRFSYGGAGIYISRSLMEKMNLPGVFETCLELFGSAFGGDAMVSLCASMAHGSLSTIPEIIEGVEDVLRVEPTLHQFDMEGDASGFFQSGNIVTSMHHFFTWVDIFPFNAGNDPRRAPLLIGRAAKMLSENFLRRYVLNGGDTVISLGYSVTTYSKPLTEFDLSQMEHTWNGLNTTNMRPAQLEGLEKRTFVITSVEPLEDEVFLLIHNDPFGAQIEVVWDAREFRSNWESVTARLPTVSSWRV